MTAAPSAPMLITYSNKDAQWVKPLLERMPANVFEWDDSRLSTGGDSLAVRLNLRIARVIVCVVSPDYLQSGFLSREEIPYLIDRRVRSGAILVVIPARPCEWRNHGWLRRAEVIPADGRALDQATSSTEELMAAASDRLSALLTDPTPAVRRTTADVNISRLPATEIGLVGRQRDLQRLDRALSAARPSIVCITGESGIGKTALVNNWLAYLAAEAYRGAARVFGWSFDTEHVTERTGSADAFCVAAADWLGFRGRLPGSAWLRGELLGSQIGASPALLVLDALDLVQSSSDGSLDDVTLLALLEAFGGHQSSGGLCVITSTKRIPELESISTQLELGELAVSSAEALMRALAIEQMSAGSVEPSTRPVRSGSPLALVLSANAAPLANAPSLDLGDIDAPKLIDRISADLASVGSESLFDLLRTLAVLDSPATLKDIDFFQAGTDRPISDSAIAELRRRRLLSPQHPQRPAEVETHSLIRKHFEQAMRTETTDAWRAAHGRVYDQMRSQFVPHPVGLSETVPLYASISHACLAGRVGEAFDAMRWPTLDWVGTSGSGADLCALENFVDASSGAPLGELEEESRGWIAFQLGQALLGIGRMDGAQGYLVQSLSIHTGIKAWREAALSAVNLFEVYQARGDLEQAVKVAEQSSELARASGDIPTTATAMSAAATARHLVGRTDQAQLLFNDVAKLTSAPVFLGLPAYWYNEFLLDRGDFDEVERRLAQATRGGAMFADALFELTRGRLFVEAPASSWTPGAVRHLDDADALFRQGSRLDYAHRTLIARAAAWRRAGVLDNANRDLQQALAFFNRTRMRLFQVECHLESARLSIARNEAANARTSLAQARELGQALGYNRRAEVIADLESQIKRMQPPLRASTGTDIADVDPLAFVFRLVLDRRAQPELLDSLDPALLPAEARGAQNVRNLYAELTAKYPTTEPNALWVAWVQATRQESLDALRHQLADGLVQGNAR